MPINMPYIGLFGALGLGCRLIAEDFGALGFRVKGSCGSWRGPFDRTSALFVANAV